MVRGASTCIEKMAETSSDCSKFIMNSSFTLTLYIRTGDLKLFVNAVKSVTLDSGFDIPTEKAQIALLTEKTTMISNCTSILIINNK